MPMAVVASTLQFFLAATFFVIPVIAYRYGDGAQQAAEAEMIRQGSSAAVLAAHRIRFAESGRETILPFGIGVALAVLGSLTLAGIEAGRIASWILELIVLVVVGFITAGQIFAARYTEAAFRKSSDVAVRALDGRAVVEAAAREFPAALRPLGIIRFALATLGSILVIVLLTTPAAGAYFG
ncbi:hypothetical protein ACFQZZ_13560 [Nocardia sp. GCM10030253]|uniref:hypothetical protein n=1 Tax=Nocardia sp. GCM10030253 TaxID=3273404 RepID=UPI003636EEC7